MKNFLGTSVSILTLAICLPVGTAFAGNAAWQSSPASGDWNTASNWSPATVPNGPNDTATFTLSNRTALSLSANTEVNAIDFNSGANAFTITAGPNVQLTISGVGIVNNSGVVQTFVAGVSGFDPSFIAFEKNAAAGSNVRITVAGQAEVGASNSPSVFFFDRSSAAESTIAVNGGAVMKAGGGILGFFDNSSAGNAILSAQSSPGNNVGGRIQFLQQSKGGDARVEVFGGRFRQPGNNIFSNGYLDIAPASGPGGSRGSVAVGSIEGDGLVFLGSNALTVGGNNLSTSFSGLIKGEDGGSLTKIGRGKLVLSHGNAYSGGTTLMRGRLLINNRSGSGTGSGPVQVNTGTLGGKGIIAGAVTMGTGSGQGALLAPGFLHGASMAGALTIQSSLTFKSDGAFEMDVNSNNATADEAIANGVTIDPVAQFSLVDQDNGTLPVGTIFIAIDNRATTPIAGRFANLANGSTFTNSSNTYRVSYNGGDGNDLTLKVIP